ncbi:MAG: site-specific integrase [Coriobacteriia bacterium]|nr:site-specific integrase [Coriobacteriia bacterium]
MARSSFGYIQKLPNKTYRVFWSDNGKRCSKRLKTYKQATEHLAKMRLRAGQCDYDITYYKYYKGVVETTYKELSPNTINEYKTAWNTLEPKIGHLRICDTNWRLVQNTINSYKSWTRQFRALKLWRKIINLAMRDDIINSNPTSDIKLTKPKKVDKKLYSKKELIEVLEQIRGTRYGLAVLMMCICGLRLEEYCGLNYRDFDFGEEGWVYVSVNQAVTSVNGTKVLKDVKTATSKRTVALHRDFRNYLSEHEQYMKNKRTLKEYLCPQSFNRNYRKWCNNHNVHYMPMGYMRSVYATLSAEAGCIDSVVSKSMGHTGNDIRERNYMSVTMQMLKLNATQLAEYIDYDDMRDF